MKWENFQQHVQSSWKDFRTETEFADVTLACADGFEVQAHRMILAKATHFFENILVNHKQPNPLIYMHGVGPVLVEALLDFIYFGVTKVGLSNINAFLALTRDIQLNISTFDQKLNDPNFAKPANITDLDERNHWPLKNISLEENGEKVLRSPRRSPC